MRGRLAVIMASNGSAASHSPKSKSSQGVNWSLLAATIVF